MKKALETSDYIFIEEIAPMELESSSFSPVVWGVLESKKPVMAVIHQRSSYPFILKVKEPEDVVIFNLTVENRNQVLEEILGLLGCISAE